MITYEELHRQLDYDLLTGFFTRRIPTERTKAGGIAGSISTKGYVKIMLNGNSYRAHRLAWFYVYGYLPENDLDHKDQIKHHNWISNLRETSKSCNAKNTGNAKNNTSSVKGVSWQKNIEKWRVRIAGNNKLRSLGCYKEFDNAVCARLAGEQCLNWENCDSSSPAFLYVVNNIQRSTKNGQKIRGDY